MHSYSIDKEIRKKTTIFIFIFSMVLSLLVKDYLSNTITSVIAMLENSGINNIVSLLGWLEVNPDLVSVPFWYGIITWLYEKFLWRYFTKLHGIPDFSGIWEGTLESSYNQKSIPMKVTIKQTWRDISIQSEFTNTNSISNSNVAAIHVDGTNGIRLYFGYSNSSYDLKNKMQEHNGYNILTLLNESTIKGRYFNDRDNPNPQIKGGNKGTIELNKK